MEIILLTIYLVTWVLINIVIYKNGMYEMNPPPRPVVPAIAPILAVGPRGARHFPGGPPPVAGMRELFLSNLYLILFETILFIAFLLLVFLGPHIHALNEAEEKSRKKYEEMVDDIFKQPWLDAVSAKNRYYIICFMILSFTPFFYMFLLFWLSYGPPFGADGITAIRVHDQIQVFDIFLLKFVAGVSGFVLFLYTLFGKKPWYFYIVPLVYVFSFYKAHNSNAAARLRNSVASLLLLIWPFFYLSKTSMLWSIPFLVLIIPLFLTQ